MVRIEEPTALAVLDALDVIERYAGKHPSPIDASTIVLLIELRQRIIADAAVSPTSSADARGAGT